MNTKNDLYARLLRLYPVASLKDYFNVDGYQVDMIRKILGKFKVESIDSFAAQNFELTKQHCYIYSLNKAFIPNKVDFNDFQYKIIKETHNQGEHNYFFLPLEQFNAAIKQSDGSYKEIKLMFLQPLHVRISGKTLVIRATIIEKNIAAYVDSPNRAVGVERTVGDDFTSDVLSFLAAAGFQADCLDINKGVKKLDVDDVIDMKYVKLKKAKSVSTEAMDEGHSFKNTYPNEHKTAMLWPLQKTVYAYRQDDFDMVPHFSADPCFGRLSFTTFPTNLSQITNVISSILKAN